MVERREFNAKMILKLQFLVSFVIADVSDPFHKSIVNPASRNAIFTHESFNGQNASSENENSFAPSEFPTSSNATQFRGLPIIQLENLINNTNQLVQAMNKINHDSEHLRSGNKFSLVNGISEENARGTNSVNTSQSFLKLTSPPEHRIADHLVKRRSYISTVLIFSIACLSVILYLGMVTGRKYLQNTYRHRDLLVQDEVPNEDCQYRV